MNANTQPSQHAANNAAAVAAASHDMQHTIAGPVSLSGVGLFTAKPCALRLLPLDANAGVVFRRTDVEGAPEVPAHVQHAFDLPRRTSLELGDARVQTVEHLLSALRGLGIDNALVELDNEEVPILDGSAADFVQAILNAGVVEQGAVRNFLVIAQPLALVHGNSAVFALPVHESASQANVYRAAYHLDYGPDAVIPKQSQTYVQGQDNCSTDGATDDVTDGLTDYANSFAPARTFSTKQEAEGARAMGLFTHVSPEDMLVLDVDGPINNTLRFADEPVRHKVLDIIGDLALTGRPIKGTIIGVRSGHALNRAMAAALLANDADAPLPLPVQALVAENPAAAAQFGIVLPD